MDPLGSTTANLAAPDVDPSGNVASDLRDLRVLQRLITQVHSTDQLTVAYALGAIRNNATTAAEVELLQSSGAIATIQALANGAMDNDDPAGSLRQFAAGCLINVRQISRSTSGEQA